MAHNIFHFLILFTSMLLEVFANRIGTQCLETTIMERFCQINPAYCPHGVTFTTFCEKGSGTSIDVPFVQAPVFNKCPGKLETVTFEPGFNEAIVRWSAVEARNSKGEVMEITQILGGKNGSLFEEGWHEIIFEAADSLSKKSNFCVITFQVKVLECGILNDPLNGKIKCSNENRIGSRCEFSCDKGWYLSGSHVLLCQQNGAYNTTSPLCQRKSCNPPAVPEMGRFSCSDANNVGSWCHFTCYNSYVPNREFLMTCRSDSVWYPDPSILECKDICIPTVKNCPRKIIGFSSLHAINISWNNITADDNSKDTIIIAQTEGDVSGSAFPVGKSTVIYEAKDTSSNIAICQIEIFIVGPKCSNMKDMCDDKVFGCLITSLSNCSVDCNGAYISEPLDGCIDQIGDNGKDEHCKGIYIRFQTSRSSITFPKLQRINQNITLRFTLHISKNHGAGDIFGIKSATESSDFSLYYARKGNFIAIYKGQQLERNDGFELSEWNVFVYKFNYVYLGGMWSLQIEGYVNGFLLHYLQIKLLFEKYHVFTEGYFPTFMPNNRDLEICDFSMYGRYNKSFSSIWQIEDSALKDVSLMIPRSYSKTECSTTKTTTGTCSHGYRGEKCNIPPDGCYSHSCQNNGICQSHFNSTYICLCKEGYSGIYCQIPLVRGGFGNWFPWSSCSSLCNGRRRRYRNCNNPQPGMYGSPCDGYASEELPCGKNCTRCLALKMNHGAVKSCDVVNGVETCVVSCSDGRVSLTEQTSTATCGSNTGYKWMNSNNVMIESNDLPICAKLFSPFSLNVEAKIHVDNVNCTDVQLPLCTKDCHLNVTAVCNGQGNVTVTCWIHTVLTSVGILHLKEFLQHNQVSENLENLVNVSMRIEKELHELKTVQIVRHFDSTFKNREQRSIETVEGILGNTEVSGSCTNGIFKGGVCVLCPIGSRFHNGSCKLCSVGTYQDTDGQTECKLCPPKHISGIGSEKKTDCFYANMQTIIVHESEKDLLEVLLPTLLGGTSFFGILGVLMCWCCKMCDNFGICKKSREKLLTKGGCIDQPAKDESNPSKDNSNPSKHNSSNQTSQDQRPDTAPPPYSQDNANSYTQAFRGEIPLRRLPLISPKDGSSTYA